MDIKQLLESAKLPEKEVQICLRADLLADFDAAEKALAEAVRVAGVTDSLDAGVDIQAAAERVVDIREQMQAASAVFRLRAVGRRTWTQLYADHPPRKDDPRDAMTGFNRDTFFEALVRASVVEPAADDTEWGQLAELLSAGQWETLIDAAWDVNQAGVDIPFSSAASRALNTTGPASGRPEASGSPSNGSTAGSRGPSTTTRATALSGPNRKRSGTKSSKG